MIPVHDRNPTRRKPVVTWVLIAINLAVFVLWEPSGFRGDMSPNDNATQETFLEEHAMIPCELVQGAPLSGRTYGACTGDHRFEGQPADFPHKNVYLAVLVSMFLHANWLHLLGNTLYLFIFGNNVEDRFGRVRYVAFYLLAGVVAALGHVLTNVDSIAPVLGASGAIAGVMGAYLVWWPRAKVDTWLPFLL